MQARKSVILFAIVLAFAALFPASAAVRLTKTDRKDPNKVTAYLRSKFGAAYGGIENFIRVVKSAHPMQLQTDREKAAFERLRHTNPTAKVPTLGNPWHTKFDPAAIDSLTSQDWLDLNLLEQPLLQAFARHGTHRLFLPPDHSGVETWLANQVGATWGELESKRGVLEYLRPSLRVVRKFAPDGGPGINLGIAVRYEDHLVVISNRDLEEPDLSHHLGNTPVYSELSERTSALLKH